MTELAYLPTLDAAYERTFTARVVALPPGAVVLDRTLFYPAGGGQPTDRGVLAGPDGVALPVADVVKSGAVVLHRLGRGARPSLRIGDEVRGTIDWDRRYGHMRLHTAQHLLSALVFRRTGRKTAPSSPCCTAASSGPSPYCCWRTSTSSRRNARTGSGIRSS